ncbi:DUF7221 family queuine tRNA-ribosyltransferase-like protein [Microvirga tunisiensis]|uniref:DeoxyPurine in DNA protein A domain-containing protein n=1 Tax=Microvirga tunisiensis TaxID=2108360 RepID=A0A5N7MMS7_9HYPH|nr:hypothetical protein [Microvirga tunisiensis]MPR10134.1 hypothetical protein [Microvirga tunisiensis]MPR28341.1 hypothetical protein [Microvirga tunisiensis]
MIKFILGLPYVMRGPLLDTARALKAPVLFSANALSNWKKDALGIPVWNGFNTKRLGLLDGMEAYLDCGGFVAARQYRGYAWSVDEYLDLCAAYPWRWVASMDYCVEPEIAGNRETVLDRISATVALNRACMIGARDRGILHRLMPVIQGWMPEDYARCLDRMPDLSSFEVIGVGSMCRRHLNGSTGILQVVEELDRHLQGSSVKLHLFGLKGIGAAELRGHPRISTVDSQAYGTRARVLAREAGFSKTNKFLAEIMADWYQRQVAAIEQPVKTTRHPSPLLNLCPPRPDDPMEARLQQAREQMRELLESGEIDWEQVHDGNVLAWAYDEEAEAGEPSILLAA